MNHKISKPLITTIIPTYRRPKLLQRAIKSVLNQTYPHFQVCVYDNASGDETAEVVAEFAKKDPRVKYYCHPK
ncbi:MAG: glycosyltransferase family 2 protein, partial [Thermotogae bacterium]